MWIRSMRREDLPFAAACTEAEAWRSETAAELESIFLNSPRTCLIAEYDDLPLGVCMGTPVGRNGFVGELIVIPEARGRHVGRRLLEECVDRLRALGAHGVFLDGVPRAVPLYERAGFEKLCRSHRFSGPLADHARADDAVAPIRDTDVADVLRRDAHSFGADRGFFLKRRVELYPELAFLLRENGDVAAFLCGRPAGDDGVHIGPLVADTPDAARRLLAHAAQALPDKRFTLGVLESRPDAMALAEDLSLAASPAPPWRMRLGQKENPGDGPGCFAIGAPAKG